jgi:hypothetical protein
MNYLEVLPLNVHEEIVKRLYHCNKPYNLKNFNNNHIYFQITYDNNDLDGIPIVESQQEIKFNDVKEIYINGFQIFKNNTFIFNCGRNYTGNYLYFNGNCRIYQLNMVNSQILNLTWEANKHLFNFLCEKIKCYYCDKKFNFEIIDGKIISNDYTHNDECCSVVTHSGWNYLEGFVYMKCKKVIQIIHNSCRIICNRCNGNICKDHKDGQLCNLCKTYNCGSEKCKCQFVCEGCKQNICINITQAYITEHENPPKPIYTCEKCIKTCPSCNKIGISTLNITNCYKCLKPICNRDECKLLYSASDISRKKGRCKDCVDEICQVCDSKYIFNEQSLGINKPQKCPGCRKENICKNCWVRCLINRSYEQDSVEKEDSDECYELDKYYTNYACSACCVFIKVPRLKSLKD